MAQLPLPKLISAPAVIIAYLFESAGGRGYTIAVVRAIPFDPVQNVFYQSRSAHAAYNDGCCLVVLDHLRQNISGRVE